jgi:hypothetical protein
MEHLRADAGIRKRQCRAHRAGVKPAPQESVGGCSPLPPVAKRQSLWLRRAIIVWMFDSPRCPRRSTRAQRTCAGRSRAPASAAQAAGCLRAKSKFREPVHHRCSMQGHPRRTLKTKRPRVETRGRSHSPREIGVTDLRERDQSLVAQIAMHQPFIARARQHVAIDSRQCSWFGNDE